MGGHLNNVEPIFNIIDIFKPGPPGEFKPTIDDPIISFAYRHFYSNIDIFKKGENVDVDLPFKLAERTGRKKICFIRCSHCGDYFVKYSHHTRLCWVCRNVRKLDAQKQRRNIAKSRREIKHCLHCDKEIPWWISRKRTFCSVRCRVAAWRESQKKLF